MPVKELQLASHWQNTVAAYNQQPVQPLTPQQVGQIKNLLKITGGISRTMMNFAIENWKAFTATVMEMKKTPGCPDAPHVGYLLKHRGIALAMMVQAEYIVLEDVVTELEAAKYFDPSDVY
jgi:phosphoglycolate phosphatase-like HAD superfamily hydrolase